MARLVLELYNNEKVFLNDMNRCGKKWPYCTSWKRCSGSRLVWQWNDE